MLKNIRSCIDEIKYHLVQSFFLYILKIHKKSLVLCTKASSVLIACDATALDGMNGYYIVGNGYIVHR